MENIIKGKNIKRRYQLHYELLVVNAEVDELMKRRREIEKELSQIALQDFEDLKFFPEVRTTLIKTEIQNNK
jgi:hypothetical protein